MGKRVKKLFLSVLMAVFGAMSLVGPVFAVPNSTNNGNDTGTHTPSIRNITGENDTESDTGTHTPSIGNITGENDTEDTKTSKSDKESDAAKVSKSCSEQVGSLSWIICPGTGLLGSIIDGAYNILTSLMQVNPIPSDESTPMYIVWEYFKNLTNSIFIFFLIFVILSQLTGIGINNYGIKKVLPRIIVTAILVNLSYIICTLAVDLSNIFGIGFRGVFENIENIAVANGSISDIARNISASSIIAGVIGVGGATAAVGGALVVFGGLEGAIWMLLPIILSGVFAVAAALITMAARQSLIFILAMISPLALVAYMLPNTEGWFKKWYQLFLRMLVFYPLFSILYGASSLASLVIITSSISDNAAANSIGVILGLAVRILPLFASIPLMKMSGTVLEKVGNAFNKLTTPIAAAVGGYAGSRQALAKQKQLAAQNPKAPSTRLAQYLNKRKALREADASEMAAAQKDNVETYIMRSRYSHGKLNARGKRILTNQQQSAHNKAVRQEIENDFDEGFKSDGSDKRIKASDRKFIKKLNTKFDDALIEENIAETRKVTIQRNNEVTRAEKIRAALQLDGDNLNNRIHQQVLAGFNIDAVQLKNALAKQGKGITLTEADKRVIDAHNEGKNFVLANAIATKRKADSVMQSTMFELLDDTTAGSIPRKKLAESFATKDYNSMKAAISVMAKRGDHGDIIEELTAHSSEIMGDDKPENIRFQKELNDICLSLKGDNSVLWSWGKANMIRRGKHDNGVKLAGFIDLDSFRKGKIMDEDATMEKTFTSAEIAQLEKLHKEIDKNPNIRNTLSKDQLEMLEREEKIKKNLNMVDMQTIFHNVRDSKLVGDMDRTVFNNALKTAQSSTDIPMSTYYMTWVKGFRDSICSGKMDGEQLDSLNNYLTMGFDTANPSLFYRDSGTVDEKGDTLYNYDLVDKELNEMFRDMSANQLASFKSASLIKFNDALNAIDAVRTEKKVRREAAANGITDEKDIQQLIKDEISACSVKVTTQDGKSRYVNKRMKDLLTNQVKALNKDTAVNTRSNMNPVIREMLGIIV